MLTTTNINKHAPGSESKKQDRWHLFTSIHLQRGRDRWIQKDGAHISCCLGGVVAGGGAWKLTTPLFLISAASWQVAKHMHQKYTQKSLHGSSRMLNLLRISLRMDGPQQQQGTQDRQ